MKSPVLVAKVLIIDEQNRGLILTRSASDMIRPGQADLPGGNVEEGEDWADAAAREIREETDLIVDTAALTLIRTHTMMKGGENIIRAFYATKSFGGEVTLSFEHSDYRWVPLEEIPALFQSPGWGESVQYALENQLL